MRFDVNQLRYIEKDAWRTLTAVEMGMKNHELVPASLVDSIAALRNGGAFKQMRLLLKHKLVHHENQKYDGYRLTPLGYDFLAIRALVARGAITGVGRKVGVGKESDVYEVTDEEGNLLALKLHRLGRTSFRNVKKTRDYLRSRTASYNWLHLSHLSALKEFAFMRALGDHGFPVPDAKEVNRHCVLMTLMDAHPLTQVRELAHPGRVWTQSMDIMARLAQHGLVHCDFNEFNLLVDEKEHVTLIDFPQMVSAAHLNADHFFERDVDCLKRFFMRRYNFRPADAGLEDWSGGLRAACGAGGGSAAAAEQLDAALRASGFGTKERAELEEAQEAERILRGEAGDGEQPEAGSSDSDDSDGSDSDAPGSDGDSDGEGSSSPQPSDDDDEAAEADASDGEASEEEAPARSVDPGVDGVGAGAPCQSQLALAFLNQQRMQQLSAGADAAPPTGVAADAAGPEGSDEGEGSEEGTVAPSVSVGLSARQCEIRERIRTERRRAGGAKAATAGGRRGGTNFSKDKSGSHKRGAKASVNDQSGVWG